jgi:integrase
MMASISRVKLKNGEVRYRVRVVTGRRDDGTAIQAMRSFRTSADAKAAARDWETDRDRGQAASQGKLRLGDYLATWLARKERQGLRHSSLHGYRAVLAAPIAALGSVTLRELTPARLQAWLDTVPTPYQAYRANRVLHTAFEEAVRLNLLVVNPSTRVSVPPQPPSRAASWTAAECRAFLAAAAAQAYHPYWLLACRLALRPCELLGLRWRSVDLEAGTLRVVEGRATVVHDAFEGPPKSPSGRRTLDLPADVLAALRAHKAAQNEARLRCGPCWREHGLVVAGALGQPIDHRNLTTAFKALIRAAGVRDIRLYDLRHTAISLMAEAGADFKAVSEIAGHADVRITRNVYQHVNRGQRKAALDVLGEALTQGDMGPKSAAF